MAGTTNITVDWSLLRDKAAELKNLKADHDQTMTQIKTLIHNLDQVWSGPAQSKLVEGFDGLQSTFNSFAQMLDSYVQLLEADAQSYEEEEANKASRQSVTFG